VSSGLAFLRDFCQRKIENQVGYVLFFFISVDRWVKEAMHPKFLADRGILCFERQCPEQNTVVRLKSKYLGTGTKIGLATLLLVSTFIQTACIFLATSHVLKYQAFHTACTFLLDVQSSTNKKLATIQDR